MRRIAATLLILLFSLPYSSAAATFTVTSANNTGAGTLRQAMLDANSNPGLDKIVFDIPNGPTTITLFSVLPSISDPVTIDATSDPDYVDSPVIILNGSLIGGTTADGFQIFADDCSIMGFAMHSFPANGIQIYGDRNVVLGCYIGTPNGTTIFGNGGEGVAIESPASDNRIGSTVANAGNLIAGHSTRGIGVASGTGNEIRGNSIFSNGLMGIDLERNLITGNDPNDGDSGANNRQNFPVVTYVNAHRGIVEGDLDSTPNTTFDIDVFVSPACSPTGHGEGKTFLGSTTATTDDFGDGDFRLVWHAGLNVGDVVTATATDPSDNTSEFSTCFEIPPYHLVAGVQDSGPNTLRQAILDANAGGVPCVITFSVPGISGGYETISPATPLPTVTASVVIDGYSQYGAIVNTNPAPQGLNSTVTMAIDGSSTTGDGLRLEGDDSVIKGLNIRDFTGHGVVIQALRCSVKGCYIGTNFHGTLAQPNGINGVMILAIGNSYIMSDIGGRRARDRNLLSGNVNAGGVTFGRNCHIYGNLVGTDKTGTAAIPNFIGVIAGSSVGTETFVGGHFDNYRNVISGNTSTGVWLTGDRVNVSGNYIGADVSGAPLGNGSWGILLDGDENVIGTGGGNIIAYNGGIGIEVLGGTQNDLRFNAIHDNGDLGIDLPPSGVSMAPAGYQSVPVIDHVDIAADRIDYSATSDASAKIRVQFFVNSGCDASGYGEGAVYLGDIQPTTQADGSISASFLTSADLVTGDIITATVESPTLGTSEFSLCYDAVNTPAGSNVVVEPDPNEPLTLTFDNVTAAGNTSVATSASGPPVPGTFTVGDPAEYYDITTTATFSGNIEVCIDYDPGNIPGAEADLKLLHFDDTLVPPAYVDVTSSLDTVNDRICGTTTHLSPFVLAVPTPPTGVGDTPTLPKSFALRPNKPNPFNPTTTIAYDVAFAGAHVTIDIYDVTGRLVRTLIDGPQSAGVQQVTWNARDDRGGAVASGVYFYRMKAPGYTGTRKMILLR